MDKYYLMYDKYKNIFHPLRHIPDKRMSIRDAVELYGVRPEALPDGLILQSNLEEIIKKKGEMKK